MSTSQVAVMLTTLYCVLLGVHTAWPPASVFTFSHGLAFAASGLTTWNAYARVERTHDEQQAMLARLNGIFGVFPGLYLFLFGVVYLALVTDGANRSFAFHSLALGGFNLGVLLWTARRMRAIRDGKP